MSDNPLLDSHLRDRERATEEATRLASVRDDLTVRYRLGLATFNAASIVALLTAVGGAPAALEKLGLDWPSLRLSVGFFIVGVVAAGFSIASSQNDLVERAGYAAARVSVQDRLISIVASLRHSSSQSAYEEAQEENKRLFKKGLKLRTVAIWAQHLSAASWLGGVAVPILSLLGWR